MSYFFPLFFTQPLPFFPTSLLCPPVPIEDAARSPSGMVLSASHVIAAFSPSCPSFWTHFTQHRGPHSATPPGSECTHPSFDRDLQARSRHTLSPGASPPMSNVRHCGDGLCRSSLKSLCMQGPPFPLALYTLEMQNR